MPLACRSPFLAPILRAPYVLSSAMALMGLLTLASWAFAEVQPMGLICAVCFVVVGSAALLLMPRPCPAWRRRLGLALAAFVAAYGAFALALHLLTVDLGLPSVSMLDRLFTGGPDGGVSQGAALGLVALGIGLWKLDAPARRFIAPAEALGLFVAALGFINLFGKLASQSFLSHHPIHGEMSWASAIGLTMAGLAVATARPDQGAMRLLKGNSGGAFVARSLAPIVVVLPIAIGSVRILSERIGWIDTPFGIALLVISMSLIGLLLVLWSADTVDRIDARRRESELKFRSVVQSAIDAIVVADAEGRIVSWNRGAVNIFGWEEYEVVGRPLTVIIPEQYRSAHEGGIERVLGGGDRHVIGRVVELLGLRKDGTEVPIELSLTTWSTAEGQCFGGVLRDVSDRHALERAKGEFLSMVSHELRTPLNLVGSALEMLTTLDLPPDKQRRMLEIAAQSTERLRRIVNDMLDIQSIQHGRFRLLPQPCDLLEILPEVADGLRPMAEQAGVTLVVSCESLPLVADPDRLGQTLTNLVHNAIKFSPRGGQIWIAAERRGDSIVLSVRDQGRGIPEEMLGTIFESFRQIEPEDASELGGTGLGLAICKAIVEAHGGRIRAESRPGAGTTMWVELPVAVLEPAWA